MNITIEDVRDRLFLCEADCDNNAEFGLPDAHVLPRDADGYRYHYVCGYHLLQGVLSVLNRKKTQEESK